MLFSSLASAAFLVELHMDGLASDHFEGTGRDSVPSKAIGVTAPNSFFGSQDEMHVYVISYTPGVDADNLELSAGADLGNEQLATGVEGGESGLYNVYATWPWTENVRPEGSKVTIQSATGDVVLEKVVMNYVKEDGVYVLAPDNPGGNNAWGFLAQVEFEAGNTYTVTFEANAVGFVSQRLHGVLFEAQIPDDPNLKIAPRIPFADVTTVDGSITEQLTLTNTGETESLEISGLRIEGEGATYFSLPGDLPGPVAVGQSETIDLTFEPGEQTGRFNAEFVAATNDQSSPEIRIPLRITLKHPEALLVHLPMDETEGTVLSDVSGNNYHADLKVADAGGSFTLGAEGLAGGAALQLDDAGATGAGYAVIGEDGSLPELYSFSVSLWTKLDPADANSVSAFFGKGIETGNPFALAAGVSAGASPVEYFVAGSPEGGVTSPAVITPGTTHHIVLVHEDTNGAGDGADRISFYVDGVLVASNEDPDGFVESVSPFYLGNIPSEVSSFGLTGVIDDFQLYERSLSTEEVAFLHQNPGKAVGDTDDPEPDKDTDGDGLTDVEEADLGTDPTVADSDGDGVSDGLEVLTGLDPLSRGSFFGITAISETAAGHEITWPSKAGAVYDIEFKEDLADADWRQLAADVAANADGNSTTWQDDVQRASGFYRVILESN